MGKFFAAFAAALMAFGADAALAAEPRPWQLGLQEPATPTMSEIAGFHTLLLVIVTLIAALVLGLLVVVMVRFRASRNATPARTSHNTVIEVLWTAVPIMILIVVAIPSFKLLYFGDRVEDADMTLKAIGHQWYWSYQYPDEGELEFDANMVETADLKDGELRLLTTDNKVVLPVDTTVRLLTTATDVIHSWAVPAFGVKLDSVPGRTNETWFRVEREGTYYGQCSELCGVRHGFMPIMVEVLSKEAYAAWLAKAKEEFAARGRPAARAIARAAAKPPARPASAVE